MLIAVAWVCGVWLVGRSNRGLPWQDATGDAPDTQDKPKGQSQKDKEQGAMGKRTGTDRALLVFSGAAALTLVCGVLLEKSGEVAAARVGLSGVLFGATVLAAATSLPEVSTGTASVRLGDYQLAVSDIFGGNAFLPVLFLLAVVISGKSVLPHAQATDIYLAALGVVLTCLYVVGLIFRPKRRVLGMGLDSAAVLGFYVVAIAGQVALARTHPGA